MKRFFGLIAALGFALASRVEAQGPVRTPYQVPSGPMLEGALSLEWSCGGHTHNVDCRPTLCLTTQQGVRHELELPLSLEASIGSLSRWSGEYVRAILDDYPVGRVHTVRQLSIIPADLRPQGFRRQADFAAPHRGANFPGNPQVGTKPYVVILAKFADRLSEPKAKSYYDGLFSNVQPGLDHYFRNVSYNQMNLAGTTVFNWITLPKPYNDYVVNGKLDFNMVLTDATAAVDASVDFRNYYGVNVMINDSIGGGIWGLGGGIYLTLDGESRVWGATLNGYSQDQFLLAHEMGHSIGLGHAGSSEGEYGSNFDPMGNGKVPDATYGSVGIHYHMFNKWWLGWIDNKRVYHGFPNTNRPVRIYRRSDPGTAGFLMARIFIGGFARKYYTLETIKGSVGGYDGAPQAGYLVVTKVDETAWPPITVVDCKPATGTATDPLLLGEEYSNPADGVRFRVTSSDATSFVVEIEVSPSVPWPHKITHTGDTGAQSLREAMIFGQEFPTYYPQFNIPSGQLTGGVAVFQPASALPTITKNAFVLNGLTQYSFAGNTNANGPEVVIDGTNAGDYVSGVYIRSSSNIIRSLVIRNFKWSGVFIEGPNITNNVVDQCYIGTSPDGMTQEGNGNEGVSIVRGAKATWVGGTTARGNLISGNRYRGIGIWDVGSDDTFVNGNKVGPNRTSTASITTDGHGISVVNGPKGTKIQNNLVSGNKLNGIEAFGAGTESTFIQGNRIGVDGTGNAALANGSSGIVVTAAADAVSGPKNTTIGGNTAALRNVISGNTRQGIWAGHPLMTGLTISGNWIGVGANGTTAVGNLQGGIVVSEGTNVKIGGITADERNVIANNTGNGIGLWKVNTPYVQGNWIGYNANRGNAGNTSLGIYLDDCAGPRIGGTTVDQRNLIGNTGSHAIGLWNNTRDGFIQGNLIGIGTLGNTSAPINGDGIVLTNGSRNMTIGGTIAGSANIIGNTAAKGISLWNANTSNNKVYGNWIGFYTDGSAAPVAHEGILMATSANANFIGGSQPTQRNIIGNAQLGIAIWTSTGNYVVGNWVGVNPAQQSAAITGTGILLNSSAANNRVSDNVLTKVNSEGISINNGSTGNTIQRNLIGFRPDGNTAGEIIWRGVYINGGSNNNTIGGTNSSLGNRIGNCAVGVGIWDSNGNQVQGNTLGLNGLNAAAPFVNDAVVIGLTSADNWIGGTLPSAGNIITNGNYGVLVAGTTARNRIRMNRIFGNRKIGINLFGNDNGAGVTANDNLDADSGPNELTNFPVINSAIPNGTLVTVIGQFNGKPNTTYALDFYSSTVRDPSEYGEGEYYVGTLNVTTDAQGNASFNQQFLDQPGVWMTATATDSLGNTSELSWAKSKP